MYIIFFHDKFKYRALIWATLEWTDNRISVAICCGVSVSMKRRNLREKYWIDDVIKDVSVEGVDRIVEEHVEKCPITLIYCTAWIVVNRRICVDAHVIVGSASIYVYHRARKYHVDEKEISFRLVRHADRNIFEK